MRYPICLSFVLEHEGGFSDDPADPGGATNYGITQRTYDVWRDDRGLSRRSVLGIEHAEVETIYDERYWTPGKCASLPPPLDLIHFDTCVNVGVDTAARTLQTALGITLVDGVIGTKTLEQVRVVDTIETAARYCSLRTTRYLALVHMRPSLRKFLRGWLHRVGDLLQAV